MDWVAIIVAVILWGLSSFIKSAKADKNKGASEGRAAGQTRPNAQKAYSAQTRPNAQKTSTSQIWADVLSKSEAKVQQEVQKAEKWLNSAEGIPGKKILPAAASRPAQSASARTASGQLRQTGSRTATQRNTTILERAKTNASRLSDDKTLIEIEAEHGHSEKDPELASMHEHSRNCPEMKQDPDAISAEESSIGTIEDLMVKGYEGNLSFDRDFLGEAQDMLSRFSIPNTDLPDQNL